MHKKKSLVLLTDFFPFGVYEPYLKHEMKFLPQYFEEILLLVTVEKSNKVIYELPSNVWATHLNQQLSFADKIFGFRFLFSPHFWNEWKFVRRQYKMKLTSIMLKTMLSYLQAASKLKRQITAQIRKHELHGKELIYYSFWNDFRSIAIAQLAKQTGSVAVARAHGWDVYFERHQPPYLPFRKFLMEHLDRCYFVSENGRSYSMAKLGYADHPKLKVARLGTQFSGTNPESNGETFVIVSCSRFVPLKRNHLIADVLQHLSFPVRWIHFGSGFARDEAERHILAVLQDHSNIHVEMRGDISNDDLFQFYAKQHVDLFMLTSEYEGMPMVLMEAMSFGIPVMATDVGGIGEMVNDENGFLIPKDFDAKEAANRIAGYRQLSAMQKQAYRKAAFETWKEKFDASKNYPRFAEELLSLA